MGRKDLDPHGRFRGEWVKESTKWVTEKLKFLLRTAKIQGNLTHILLKFLIE